MIRKLIYKMRKRRFCKLNRWFCPDCIYHDFVFEGVTFRGNRCRYPQYRKKEREMTREEAREELITFIGTFECPSLEAVEMAIEALKGAEINCVHCPRYFETEDETGVHSHCEDLISRAEAIEVIEETDWYHQNGNKDMVHGANDDEHQAWYKAEDVYKALEAVPSADRPRGKWHYSNGKPATIGRSFGVICDQCGAESEYCTNFCGECGADMRVTEGAKTNDEMDSSK